MKSWQDWINGISSLSRQLPAASRWVLIACVAITLLLLLGSQSFFGQQQASLFESRHLTADEVGLMQVAFGKSGLNEYEIRGTQVLVPQENRADYLKALAEHGAVPQDLRGALESNSSFDFFQTRAQQRLQHISRKKQTIRDMVMQLRFVERAIVDYDETRGATPFEDMQRTAVVNVCPAGSRALTLSEVKAIRDTVRGAVAGLQAAEITIIDTFASKSHTGVALGEADHLQPHTWTKMQAERKYENKIRSALTAYPGIRVNVEVGIDPVVRRIRDERNLDQEPVIVERTTERETRARFPSTGPSILLNSVFRLGSNTQAQVGSDQQPRENRSTERTQSMANGTFQTTETLGPMVTNVNVSIGVPERCVEYFVERNAQGKQPPAEEVQKLRQRVFEQLQLDIQQKVSPLVPVMESASQPQQIVVTLDREIPLVAELATPAIATPYLIRHWPWMVLFAAGLCFGLMMLRTGSRSSPADDDVRSDFVHTVAPIPDDTICEPMAPEMATRAGESNETLELPSSGDAATPQRIRGQLDQWCRENPQAAAATIRQWLERKAG